MARLLKYFYFPGILLRALVEDEAMCKLIFPPLYSPDLNPIEPAL